jgi:Tfp pilus assembly protein PilV
LEVLVAVAILALSLTSLISSQIASIRATAQARDLSTVVFLAEAKLIDVEYELIEEGGWGDADQTFTGDFSDEGWPSVTYICVADLIEMPDYNQLVAAEGAADTDGFGGVGGTNMQDAGDAAFDTIGMVWPMIKEAIEQSIRKSWCTVRWESDIGGKRRTQGDEQFCGEDENNCLTLMTFWTDPTKLMQLPSAGGEAGEDDEGEDDDGGGGGDGGRDSGKGPGGPGGGGPGGGIGPGGGSSNSRIPQPGQR